MLSVSLQLRTDVSLTRKRCGLERFSVTSRHHVFGQPERTKCQGNLTISHVFVDLTN